MALQTLISGCEGAGGGQCGTGRGGGRVTLHSRATEVAEGHRGGSGAGRRWRRLAAAAAVAAWRKKTTNTDF
jgi:hypothetical protein